MEDTQTAANDAAGTDGRRLRGRRTRHKVVEQAIQAASVHGIEGLSLAEVAARVGVPKSSVHAAFGTKENLQIAVLERTRAVMMDLVVAPALAAAPGRARLAALGEAWLGYLAGDVFEGGCVLAASSTELDGRPGPPREALRAVMSEWLDFLARTVTEAVQRGELPPDTDPRRTAFQLHSIGYTTNWSYQLFGDRSVFDDARTLWSAAVGAAPPE